MGNWYFEYYEEMMNNAMMVEKDDIEGGCTIEECFGIVDEDNVSLDCNELVVYISISTLFLW